MSLNSPPPRSKARVGRKASVPSFRSRTYTSIVLDGESIAFLSLSNRFAKTQRVAVGVGYVELAETPCLIGGAVVNGGVVVSAGVKAA